MRKAILDHGYVELVEVWGSEERIIEAARMSTGRGFLGWGPLDCPTCKDLTDGEVIWLAGGRMGRQGCEKCKGRGYVEGDEKLLRYLYTEKPQHSTPFEMAGLVIEVQAPIMVYREWHRHRTQCLAGSTRVYFESPSRVRSGTKSAGPVRIDRLYKLWSEGTKLPIRKIKPSFSERLDPERYYSLPELAGLVERRREDLGNYVRSGRLRAQTMARISRREPSIFVKGSDWVEFSEKVVEVPIDMRPRMRKMLLRCFNEETKEFTTTTIVDVIKSGEKPLLAVRTKSGEIVASAEHRFITDRGWMRLGDAIRSGAGLLVSTRERGKETSWETAFDYSKEVWTRPLGFGSKNYEISDMGRLRRTISNKGTAAGRIKSNSIGAQGYPIVQLHEDGASRVFNVHTLVLEAFVGPCPQGMEARHADHNRKNCCLSNLSWGTSKENHEDMIRADRQQRLVGKYEPILQVTERPPEVVYDLEVEGPWHNFVAEGFVVHNSYNEMSGRYTALPDVNYTPSVERLLVNSKTNKQAGVIKGAEELTPETAEEFQRRLGEMWEQQEQLYQWALQKGVPKELARVHVGVGRYSRMRASANLLNWLKFLTLRMHSKAQWEIRQYANAVGEIVARHFPRTWAMFEESRPK